MRCVPDTCSFSPLPIRASHRCVLGSRNAAFLQHLPEEVLLSPLLFGVTLTPAMALAYMLQAAAASLMAFAAHLAVGTFVLSWYARWAAWLQLREHVWLRCVYTAIGWFFASLFVFALLSRWSDRPTWVASRFPSSLYCAPRCACTFGSIYLFSAPSSSHRVLVGKHSFPGFHSCFSRPTRSAY